MLTDCGRKNITPEAFKSQAGDYLGVAYALQIADMLAHHPFMFTSLASEAKQEGRLDKANVEQYKVMVAKELFGKIADFLQTRSRQILLLLLSPSSTLAHTIHRLTET